MPIRESTALNIARAASVRCAVNEVSSGSRQQKLHL
jgi:hypothetical protein